MDEQLLKTLTDTIVEEAHPEAVVLFGSHARESAHDTSDIDLLVIMPNDSEARRNRRGVAGSLYRCLASMPVSKDILVYTRNEIEQWRNVPGHIIAIGLAEGKRLYGNP